MLLLKRAAPFAASSGFKRFQEEQKEQPRELQGGALSTWSAPMIQWKTMEITARLLRNGFPQHLLLTPLPFLLQDRQQENSPALDNEKGSEEVENSHDSTSLEMAHQKKSSEQQTNESHLLKGEKRLIIHFEQFGTIGMIPQPCCRNMKCFVPDGLIGSHKMYGEHWRFKISHTDEYFIERSCNCVCLLWEITNILTGNTVSHRETRKEALLRIRRGDTVSSRLFRQALELQAQVYETELSSCDPTTESIRFRNLRSKIGLLRPKKFSEGTLVFGLQHAIVQCKIKNPV